MDSLRKQSSKQQLKWLLKCARPAQTLVLLSVGLGLCSGLLLVAQAGLLAQIVQAVFVERVPRYLVTGQFVWLAAVIASRAGLAWGREVTGFKAGARVREEIRMALIKRIVDLGPAYTERQRTGDLVSVALEQVEALHDFFAHYLPQLALAVLIPAAIFAFIFPLSWAAGLVLLATAPLIPLFMILVGMGAESISQRNFQALSRLSAHFLDILQGLPTLKLFGRSRSAAAEIAGTSAEYRRQTMQVLRVAFLSSAVLEFFSAVAIALVAVYLGMHYLGYLPFGDYGRPLDLGSGFFILLLAPDFYLPLRELGTHYHARAAAVGAAEGILKVLSTTGSQPLSRTGRCLPEGPIGVRFEDVAFTYGSGRQPVLRGITFEMAEGERLALVGASGAGKTTLLNLLMAFVVPTSGRIMINSEPIDGLNPEGLRRKMAWVGQRPVLFDGTVRENILFGRPEAAADALEDAARAARVIDFCRHLPDGLDTRLGEQGVGLSRGQAQRVALARAYLKNAPLLLLDEPTAGLDTENEKMVLEALETLTRGRTVLMATHRLENLQRADHIVVLGDGRIVEQGRYVQLMRTGSAFYRLAPRGAEGGGDG